MPYPKIYIDAMLLNWGDRLFHAPLKHVGAPRLSRARLGDEAARMRAQLARTLKRAPEVMVKITNKASGVQGMGAVRRHLRYISRSGQVELEDQDGLTIVGADALRDLTDAWQLGGWGVPEKSGRRASCSEAALEMICAHYPDRWVQHYQKNGYALVDPVHRTAFTQTAPYRWRDIANLNPPEQRVLDEALEAGLANGISIPIHEPMGRVLLVNLSGQASVVNAEATRRLAHLISTQFHYELERLGKHQSAAVSQRLTPRQCECLTWVARGKSSWTIGQLLGISHHTVDYHIDTAMEALNVNSRTSAAVKAAVLGLIRP